jgi:hypothetical protein
MDANKYTEAVRLLSHCRDAEDNVELHRRFDQFVAHLCDNFPVPDAMDSAQLDAAAALLRLPESELEAAVQKITPSMEDAFFPVVLMRIALLIYQIPLTPTKSKNFEEFHKTYGPLLSDAVMRNEISYEYKPKTAQDIENKALTQLNKQTNWSSC